MEEQLISFKTAKLAKEKGFPQNINYTSWYNEFGTEKGRTDLDKEGKPYEGMSIPVELKEAYKRESFSAPTQSILQKWFRKLPTPIIVTPETDFCTWWVEILHPDEGLTIISRNSDGKWINSFEEALEIGLQEAFKLIK